MFPIGNIAHVRSRKIFYHICAHFRNPGFRLVSKPRKPVLIFRTGLTTTFCAFGVCAAICAFVTFLNQALYLIQL